MQSLIIDMLTFLKTEEPKSSILQAIQIVIQS